MKKTLIALTTALLLAGAAGSATAQQVYYDRYGNQHIVGMDYNRNGIPDGYYGDNRYYDRRYTYDRYDSRMSDRDCDGVPDRNDYNDQYTARDADCDGVPNRYDLYDDRGYYSTRTYAAPVYYGPRGYTYGTRWEVGSRLPYGYYGSRYYIDYRPYGLAPPPYGYRWNRVGTDAYLVNTTSGLISEIVYSLFR